VASGADSGARRRRGPATPLGAASLALAWLVVAAWAAGWTVALWSPAGTTGISWHFFVDGSRALLHTDGLHTYAVTPTLQIGPLALLVAGVFTALGESGLSAVQLAGMAAFGLVVWAIADRAPAGARHTRVLTTGLVLAPPWAVLAVRWTHLDDVLALLLLGLTVRVVTGERARPVLAGVLVAAAAAAKPWAIIGLALLLVTHDRRERTLGLAVAALGTALAWGPFVIADPGTLTALRPAVGVSDTSILWLLGWRADTIPAWGRTAQLIGAPLIALALAAVGRWPAALLAGIAVRLALDPQDIAYYAAGAVLAALVLDLHGRRSRWPWLGLVTALVWWQPFVPDFERRLELSSGWALWWFEHPQAVATIDAIWVVTVLAVCFGYRPRVASGPRFGRHTGSLVN